MKRVGIISLSVVILLGSVIYYIRAQQVSPAEEEYVKALGNRVIQALIEGDREMLSQNSRGLKAREEGISYECAGEIIEYSYMNPETRITGMSFAEIMARNTIIIEFVAERDDFAGIGFVILTFVRDRDGWKLTKVQYDI